jgi:hypothetical protein
MEFLCTCINLIKDESVVQELQNLIRQYELGKVDPLLNKSSTSTIQKEKDK